MYRLHNSSEHSGVTNMYSLSNVGNGSSREDGKDHLRSDLDLFQYCKKIKITSLVIFSICPTGPTHRSSRTGATTSSTYSTPAVEGETREAIQ